VRRRWVRIGLRVLGILVLVGGVLLTLRLTIWNSSSSPTAPITSYSAPGITVTYPLLWSAEPVPNAHANDVIAVIRDPAPPAGFDPGLVLRKTPNDTIPVDQDLTALLEVNRLQFPDGSIQRQGGVSVNGATEADIVVTDATVDGVPERIVDIIARTSGKNGYHLQAIAPATLLTTATIDAMVSGLKLS
jgi:hypothetical protein